MEPGFKDIVDYISRHDLIPNKAKILEIGGNDGKLAEKLVEMFNIEKYIVVDPAPIARKRES